MFDDIPNVDDLFEILIDDEDWIIFADIYYQINSILNEILKEISSVFSLKGKEIDFHSIPYFLISCIYRTKRIFHSITILSIYNRFHEIHMLERPFLENILQTRIFLDGKRAKLIRKIKLYILINNSIYYKKELKNINVKLKHRMFTSKCLINTKENLEEKIYKGLIEYRQEEIEKMHDKIKKGISWYGDHIKKYFKEYQLENYILDYDHASTFIHVREEYPFYPDSDNDAFGKLIFIETLKKVLKHIIDFKKICQNTFYSNDILSKIKKYEKKLIEIDIRLTKEVDPSILEIIELKSSDEN